MVQTRHRHLIFYFESNVSSFHIIPTSSSYAPTTNGVDRSMEGNEGIQTRLDRWWFWTDSTEQKPNTFGKDDHSIYPHTFTSNFIPPHLSSS